MPNNILRYTGRDYKSIKEDLIDAIPTLTSTWTSREDGDPGIVLVKLMSALGDMLSFNFDKQALEYYSPTVTQRKNAARLFEFLAYKMHWYRSAITTLTLTYTPPVDELTSYCKRVYDNPEQATTIANEYRDAYFITGYDEHDNPIYADVEYFPPTSTERGDIVGRNGEMFVELFAGRASATYVSWQQNNSFDLNRYLGNPSLELGVYSSTYSDPVYSLEPTTEPSVDNVTEKLYAYVPMKLKALQGQLRKTQFETRVLRDNCFYIPDMNIDEDHIYLSYRSVVDNKLVFVKKVDNLLTESDGKLHFQFRVDDYDYPYIELSSYWKSSIGQDSVTFTLYYFTTLGASGNITTDYLKEVQSIRSNNIIVSNIENTDYHIDKSGHTICSPGANPQTATEAYKDSLNYVMTYNTLVTPYDFTRFLKRLDGISNAYVYDKKTVRDVNSDLQKLCNTYTREQLINILGESYSNESDMNLRDYLYQINALNYNFMDCPVTKDDIDNATDEDTPKEFVPYHANFCPIVSNFSTSDEDGTFAVFTNQIDEKRFPYKIYKINTKDDSNNYKIQTQIENVGFDESHIANVQPNYGIIRVFDWTLNGTVHLNKQVSEEEAANVISNIVNTVAELYRSDNVIIGKKINYMELIDIITSCDDRIRYFDAGMGSKKLVNFETPSSTSESSGYFRTEAYFNVQSIMRFDAAKTINADHPCIIVDPEYIEKKIKPEDIRNTSGVI